MAGRNQIVALIALFLPASCAAGPEPVVRLVPRIQAAIGEKPKSGHALVVFIRPSEFESIRHIGEEAAVYDGERYVGIVLKKTRIHFQAQPGLHHFMVFDTQSTHSGWASRGDSSADFARGTLVAGKTYVFVLRPRRGATVGAYRFGPKFTSRTYDFLVAGPGTPENPVIEWIESTDILSQSGKYANWDNRHHEQAMIMRKHGLALWNSRLAKAEFDTNDAY